VPSFFHRNVYDASHLGFAILEHIAIYMDGTFTLTGEVSLDPHADIGALTPSADWVKCCFSKNFLESF